MKRVFMFGALALMSVFLIGCEEPEQEDNGKGANYDLTDGSHSYAMTIQGKRLTGIYDSDEENPSSFEFGYGDKGELTEWRKYTGCDWEDYEITHNPLTLTLKRKYFEEKIALTFNDDGYISNCQYSRTYKVLKTDYVADISYTYNKNNQVSKIVAKVKSVYGKSVTGDIILNLSYKGEVLLGAEGSETLTAFGETAMNYPLRIEYGYSEAVDNKLYQYSPDLAWLVTDNAIDEDSLFPLAVLGLFGKASAKFPTHIKVQEGDDVEEHNYSTDLNEDGTINESDSFSYTYSDDINTKAAEIRTMTATQNKKPCLNRKFKIALQQYMTQE